MSFVEALYVRDEDNKAFFEPQASVTLDGDNVLEGLKGQAKQAAPPPLADTYEEPPGPACPAVPLPPSQHGPAAALRAACSTEDQLETKDVPSGRPTVDIIAHAGLLPAPIGAVAPVPPGLPDRSAMFADVIGQLDFTACGDAESPHQLMQGFGTFLDDLEGRPTATASPHHPETPLPLLPHYAAQHAPHFPVLHPDIQVLNEALPPRPGGNLGKRRLSHGAALGAFAPLPLPGSPLATEGRAHSLPAQHARQPVLQPCPSPLRPAPIQDHDRAMSMPAPLSCDGLPYCPPIRTSLPRPDLPSPPRACQPRNPAPRKPRQISAFALAASSSACAPAPRPKVSPARRLPSLALALDQSLELPSRACSTPHSDSGIGSRDSSSAFDSETDSAAAGDSAVRRRKSKGGVSKRSPSGGPGRRAGRRMACRNCHTSQTPQWRCGPEGPRTLCNACGVRYKKGMPLSYMLEKAAAAAAAAQTAADAAVIMHMDE